MKMTKKKILSSGSKFLFFSLSFLFITTFKGFLFPGFAEETGWEYLGPKTPRISVIGVNKTTLNRNTTPYRMYVEGNGKSQKGPKVVLRVAGLKPFSTIQWSYQYYRAPLHDFRAFTKSLFSPYKKNGNDFSFNKNMYSTSTITNKYGESYILFTASTYAGDRYKIIVRENKDNATIPTIAKSNALVVWKRLYIEKPKVLKNVRFPQDTLNLVRTNLEKLNIELMTTGGRIILDPKHRGISNFFGNDTGDLRYGPNNMIDFTYMLKFSRYKLTDKNQSTINVVIMGSRSKESDLIKNRSSSPSQRLQSENHFYTYKKKDVDYRENYTNANAIAYSGDSPSIFIWSDYCWVVSKILKMPHEKVLAGIILHELGHHLLMFERGKEEWNQILDSSGHLSEILTTQRSIMNGIDIRSERREKKFFKNPKWHPEIEKLIRRDFIPSQQ
jgi:hypothetical protein